jgi:hypothetical protein
MQRSVTDDADLIARTNETWVVTDCIRDVVRSNLSLRSPEVQTRLLCPVCARPMGTTVEADAASREKFARIVSATYFGARLA